MIVSVGFVLSIVYKHAVPVDIKFMAASQLFSHGTIDKSSENVRARGMSSGR